MVVGVVVGVVVPEVVVVVVTVVVAVEVAVVAGVDDCVVVAVVMLHPSNRPARCDSIAALSSFAKTGQSAMARVCRNLPRLQVAWNGDGNAPGFAKL